MHYNSAVDLAHFLITQAVSPGDRVVDATLGNGNDTLLLAKLVGPSGRVYGFDIQSQALTSAKDLLRAHQQIDQVELFLRSHAELASVIQEPIQAAMFNLGFLPGSSGPGADRLTTKGETTVEALKQLLRLLKPGGLITVVIYLKHDSGAESAAVEGFLSEISQQEFNIFRSSFINQVNEPPYLIAIEKLRGEP